MSRNIGLTDCRICYGPVELIEAPRPATEADCGPLLAYYQPGFMVALAHCRDCSAKYLAWVDVPGRGGHLQRTPGDLRPFVDLSFRSTFNDEPGPEDLPSQKE